MYYCVIKGKDKFIALCKSTPFTSKHPDPIREPGEVYFEIADTAGEALEKLRRSLKEAI